MSATVGTAASAHPKASTGRPHSRARRGDFLASFLKYGILIVLAITYVLPFFWMVSSALKNDAQIYVVPPTWIPSPAYWENFYNAWTSQPFTFYMANTLFRYAVPATIGTVLSCAIVAYGFSRLQWPGRDALFYLCLATMMVPFQVQMVPLFIIFKNFGWINTFLPLIVPAFFGAPFYIFMLRQFFLTIPAELSDAARIDGASEFGILFRIILPLSKPALTVVALLAFVGAWNDYLGPLIYLHDADNFVLSQGIESMRRAFEFNSTVKNAYPYLMAVSTIVVVPIVVLFFFGQRMFIEGISMTGIKE
jgi:ABC-type glycerol-3-phosphate transport system permease component